MEVENGVRKRILSLYTPFPGRPELIICLVGKLDNEECCCRYGVALMNYNISGSSGEISIHYVVNEITPIAMPEATVESR